jgi:hypothetical protein
LKGEILDYAISSGEGIISAEDGTRYNFKSSEWTSNDIHPERGLKVDFLLEDNKATKIYAIKSKTDNVVNIVQQETSVAAIISLIFGIIGLLFDMWTFAIPSLIAIISGHIARSNIKGSNGKLTGDGMASGGLILGYITLVLYLIVFIFIVGALGALGGY